MGLLSSKLIQTPGPDPSLAFSAAGILFTNQTHVLAGYQPHKCQPCITGIGGAKCQGETALQTAWRETIEELFDCTVVPSKFLEHCTKSLVPYHWFQRGDYICFEYSFDHLKTFLKLAKRYHLSTSVYESYPTTLFELLMNRMYSETSEVQSLCLLPFIRETNGSLHIHHEFCLDLDQLAFHQSADIS